MGVNDTISFREFLSLQMWGEKRKKKHVQGDALLTSWTRMGVNDTISFREFLSLQMWGGGRKHVQGDEQLEHHLSMTVDVCKL